jgi:16S rRNA (cytidine1402-2'-O)-methyltransferase
MKGTIYLIPNFLGESSVERSFPQENVSHIRRIKHFIVEDVRTVRRFLKKVDKSINIDELSFFVLDKHTKPEEVPAFLKPAEAGHDMGIISEAGCPGVADPGADVVAIAHGKGLKVVPLVGPSSILMAMMASGMNGQNFAFTGYLPVEKSSNIKAIKQLEDRAIREKQTQIFIETPFRNNKMLDDLLFALRPSTRLCIACNVTCDDEYIVTKSVGQWRSAKLPDINKKPTIFLIGI